MANVKPFRGIRPPREYVEKVASKPYDVLSSDEARAEAGDNEMSLYHIITSFISSPGGVFGLSNPLLLASISLNFEIICITFIPE